MSIELVKFMYVGKNVDPEFFEEIQSTIDLIGLPDQIVANQSEASISWEKQNPDRVLELVFYVNPDFDIWYEKTVFYEDGESVEKGWAGNKLYELSEFLKYGNEEYDQ